MTLYKAICYKCKKESHYSMLLGSLEFWVEQHASETCDTIPIIYEVMDNGELKEIE
jgi:hypothetical protein